MEEVEQPENTAGAISDTATQTRNRMADATSGETLSDVEEAEGGATKNLSGTSAGERSSVAAPDGTPDSSRGKSADGSDDAGPM